MRNLALHLALLTLVSATAAHAQQAASAPSLRGDVNGDGRVTTADAQAVRDYVAGRPVQPGTRLLPNGDVNGDGRITGVDAAMIQAFAAGRDVSRFGVGQPIRAGGEARGGYMTAVRECTVDVEAGTETCRTPRPATAASADIVVVSRSYVSFVTTNGGTSRGNPADEDTTSANLAVISYVGQPIGTLDGTNPASTGIRVFFAAVPQVTAVFSGTLASAWVRVEGTDGNGNFAGPEGEFSYTDKPFYQYNGVLATGDTSTARQWMFVYSSNTRSFTYSVAVSAPVQYEFGWVTITPASLVLGPAEASAALGASSRSATGAAMAAEPLTWSSSDPAVATVDASTGVVTGVAPGTATITATSMVKAQRKGSITVTVDAPPTLVSTTPADNATQVASMSNIELTFSEPVDVTTSSFTLECPAGTAKTFTVSGSGTAVVTLNPDADLPAGTICTVKVIGVQVSDSDANDGPNDLAGGDRTFSFEVNIRAVADVFGTTTTGNVRINSASTSPAFSVTDNDQANLATTTITFAGWNAVAGKTQQGGDVTMTMSGAGMGQFTYNPPAGFEGTDTLEYTITSGAATASAKVALPVSGMIWFVNNTGAPCTSGANGCGRLTNPYSTLAAFQAENDGTGNNPAANEAIFVYQSTTAYAGPVTLLAGQKLIGQDATATLQAISGITPAAGSEALPAMDAAGTAVTIKGTDGVNLGAGNTLRGLTLAPTAGEAISGTSFGTLALSTTTPDLKINAGGQALALTTGAITGTFTSVASAGGTHNVLLSGVAGDIDFGAGALSGSTGGAIKIVGGALTLDASGSIGQTTAFPLLDVSGTHTGTLTFTGTLSATAGTGLQFSDADGSYSFGGATTLNGGDAGIDITAGSAGTFSFGSGTSVTNPSGAAFRVAASTPGITYNGNLTKSGASPGLLVDISGQASGTITFANGTLSSTSTAGTGIQLSDVDGTVSFNGTTMLSNGDNGVDVIGGSTGAISFGINSTITSPSGGALRVFNGGASANLTFAGNLGTNAGRPVHVEGVSGGTVAVTGSIAATGQGLLAQNNTGGTFSFTNASKSFNTGAHAAVTLTSNTGAAISFTNGLAITTTTGAGIHATGGGNLTVSGGINTISTGSGTALRVDNTTIASGGLTFRSIAANGGANGIFLNNTGSTAGLTVTGAAGTAGSGGTIQNTTGADGTTSGIGIYLNNTLAPSFSWMQLNGHAGWAIRGIDVANLTLANMVVSGTNGSDVNTDEGAVFFTNLTGTASVTSSSFSGGAEDNFKVFNTGGTLDRITFTTVTFGANSAANGSDALLLQGRGGSVLNATITGSTFTAARGDLFQFLVEQQAQGDLVFSNNTLNNNHPNIAAGGGGVTVTSGGDPATDGSALTYSITGNTLRGSRGAALVVQKLAGHGTASGTVSGNFIGVSGQVRSGSIEGSGISMGLVGAGSHTTTIGNNTIRQYRDHGIYVQTGSSAAGGGNGGRMVASITGNTVAERAVDASTSTFFPGNGIRFVNGSVSTDVITACLTIAGNSVTGQGVSPQTDIRVWDRYAAGTFALPGLGAPTANASTFVQSNNGGTPTVQATSPDQFTTTCP
jgi:methionine-rich copper-binding protein CopC